MVRVVLSIAALVATAPAIAQEAAQPSDDPFASMLGVQGGLTVDEAAQRAAATSTDVAASLADLQASQAAAAQARWQFLPTIALKAQYARISRVDPDISGCSTVPPTSFICPGTKIYESITAEDTWALSADAIVPVSDYVLRIPQLVSAAGKSEEASAISERASRVTVASQARSAYWNWVGARLMRVVAQQNLDAARGYLKDAQASATAGVISNADLLQAQAAVSRAELGLAAATAGAQIAEQQLATALHDPPGKEYAIGETLSTDVTVDTAAIDALWDEARRTRLEVRSLNLAVEALHQNASAARVNAFPKLEGFAGILRSSPNQRWSFIAGADPRTTWQAGGQLTWVPTAMPQILAGADQADAQAAKLEAQRARLIDALRVEVAAALNGYERARVALASSQQQLAAAEEGYRVRRLLFQNGRATGTEVTQALSELTAARQVALNARIDVRVAAVQLLHALGRDVPAST